MRHILRCKSCNEFTMKEKCKCGGDAVTTQPPKYSPDDKYADYIRKAKRKILEEKGLL